MWKSVTINIFCATQTVVGCREGVPKTKTATKKTRIIGVTGMVRLEFISLDQ